MGWDAVWQLALKQFGAEVVEIRLLILLAAAFFGTMILVGLKHAFRSAEPKSAPPPPAVPKRIFAAAPATAAATAAPPEPRLAQPDGVSRAPLKVIQPATRKSAKRTINRQQATRPLIRRNGLPSLAENRLPSPPLPAKR